MTTLLLLRPRFPWCHDAKGPNLLNRAPWTSFFGSKPRGFPEVLGVLSKAGDPWRKGMCWCTNTTVIPVENDCSWSGFAEPRWSWAASSHLLSNGGSGLRPVTLQAVTLRMAFAIGALVFFPVPLAARAPRLGGCLCRQGKSWAHWHQEGLMETSRVTLIPEPGSPAASSLSVPSWDGG